MELTLYFAPEACSQVPLVALEESGRPFTAHLVTFMKGEHKSPEYLSKNPAGKVPLLIADGEALAQNPAIQIFLARSFPDCGLLPLGSGAMSDARVISYLNWFSADLHQLVTRIRFPVFACDAAPDRTREQATEGMIAQLKPLEARLGDQEWFLGANWSTLDAYLYWVWFRITGAGFPASVFPNIVAHHERMQSRPAVQRALQREAEARADLERRGLMPGSARKTGER